MTTAARVARRQGAEAPRLLERCVQSQLPQERPPHPTLAKASALVACGPRLR